MKAIMISINKPHTDNIFSGKKTNEWRTRPLPLGKAYVYETKHGGGCGKVIGEMEIVKTYRFHTDDLIWQSTFLEMGCVPYNFVRKYANGKEYISANIIANVKKYDTPKELGEFVKPSNGCCNEGKCKGCKFLDIGIDGIIEDDCSAEFDTDSYSIVKRPPQSWFYCNEFDEV